MLLLTRSPSAAAQGPAPSLCPTFRYIYATTQNARTNHLEVYGCKTIVPMPGGTHDAGDCQKLGDIDLTLIKKAEAKAKESLYAYTKGLVVGMGCYVSVHALKTISKPAKFLMGIWERRKKSQELDRAVDETLAGKRKVGEAKKDSAPSMTSQICTAANAAVGNESFMKGVKQAMKPLEDAVGMAWTFYVDAKAVWLTPVGEKRQKAFEEWQKKLQEKSDRQERVIDFTSETIVKIYDLLMLANSVYNAHSAGFEAIPNLADRLPIGNSPKNVKVGPESCILPPRWKQFHLELQNFFQLTAETKKSLENFKPHQEILVPVRKEVVLHRLKTGESPKGVMGIHHVVPGQQKQPELPKDPFIF